MFDEKSGNVTAVPFEVNAVGEPKGLGKYLTFFAKGPVPDQGQVPREMAETMKCADEELLILLLLEASDHDHSCCIVLFASRRPLGKPVSYAVVNGHQLIAVTDSGLKGEGSLVFTDGNDLGGKRSETFFDPPVEPCFSESLYEGPAVWGVEYGAVQTDRSESAECASL